MKKKIGIVIIAIVAIISFLLSYIISYANNGSIYVNITETDLNNIGYGIGDPKNGGAGKYIWTLRSYDSNNIDDLSKKQRNLYCIKAGYGDAWNPVNNGTIVEYNLSYDFQGDRENLLTLLENGTGAANELVLDLLYTQDAYYRELLWIFDNMYIENETNKDDFLAKIGIKKDDEGYYNENTNKGYDFILTDADIKAVQAAAIWHFTNYKLDGENAYNQEGKSEWLTITEDGANYNNLSELTKFVSTEGEDRNEQATLLYDYLVQQATANADKYTEENEYKIQSTSANVNTTGLTQDTNGIYNIQSNRTGANYIVGPIVIDGDANSDFQISMTLTDQDGNIISPSAYTFTDNNGTSLGNVTLKDLVGRTGGFYISIARNLAEEVNIQIDITQETINKTLWLEGTEDADSIDVDSEQPLVEVTREEKTSTTKLNAKLREFDLALRKYITQVNGVAVTDTRVPNISTNTLLTGTTATYNHRKDPVAVLENDTVTYSITVYNEGTKDGYAKQIIDQLPTGLINSTENSATIVSKDKNGNDKNSYTLTYNTTSNQITFDIVEGQTKNLSAYSQENGLDYETITIKCKVLQKADEKVQKILTNVAWISEAYNAEDDLTIVNQSKADRDSEPGTAPSVTKGNMENYIGKTTNKTDLTDSNYYYEGEQDDDDFEKLVINPIQKKFDLALFKHIAAISKDQNIEPGEYVTDTGNIDGTYLRAPVVTNIDSTTGKITYKEDDKAALTVEPGDYVLYTIRVYNEGEIDGYASKIKDTLPIGLEFVTGNEEYNGIWNLEGLDSDGRQVITTTWYAKGQGAELNSVEGDANYTANLLKALNPEGAISNENPDYIDAQVLCKVVEKSTSDRVLVNYAQISDDSDKDGNPVDDVDSTPDEWIDSDDDQDIERIKLQCFDLSLRKFITAVNGTELKDSDGKYTREPVVDTAPLKNGTSSTATYTHSKKPVAIQAGDKIVYTIRVYNEGDINGYASEAKDYLPPYLTYLEDSEINNTYGWSISEDGRIATTKYLATKELTAFDGTTTLDYEDIKIECIVSENAPIKENVTNIAEISEYTYNGNTVPKDADSIADNMKDGGYLPEDKDLPSYKDQEIDKTYVPGNEDDDDFEKVYVKEFDLALRKFITEIQGKEVTSRVPEVKYENGQIRYEHSKDAITVHVGDTVIYTIRIYNEGEIDGYASEITDDIPEYLEYLPEESTNVDYMWKMYDENGEETQELEEAVKVKTEYLSKDNSTNNLIQAFDGNMLYYKDIKIAFKVKDPNSNTIIITNHAQISDDTDENGNPIKDKDSETDKWNEGEDDQDIENVKVEYFDLSLLKFVSKVIVVEDGKETITETGYNGHEDPEPVVKVELHRKKLNQVTVKFGYGITITNEGDIPGYATEITDYVPEGLKFEASDNPNWTDEGNNVISTKQLENTLLQPGESKTIEVILTWINGNDNLALKTNTAEISEDNNEYDVPDRDSTPDNKKEGEDDIDIAKVILSVATGSGKTYFTLTLGLLTIVLLGVAAIKKFVI